MKSRLSTKNKHTTQRIRKKTINIKALLIGVVVLTGATAPYWHLLASKDSEERFIGFFNYRSFLYSFGIHLTLLCSSIFVFWIKNFIDPQYKKIIRAINFTTGLFFSISIYFLLWVFNSHSDFPIYYYRIAFALTAIFIAYGTYLLNNFIAHIKLDKKQNIINLLAFIFRIRDKYYKKIAVKALYAEIHNKALKTDDTVTDNTNAFEEDFYDTLEKVN